MLKFSLLAVLLFTATISFAQQIYVALITEPQIGPQENANNLINVVDDINKRETVSYVIVLGNITANGKIEEFIWAQEILDGLNVPYFVVGGEKDYSLSEGKGSEISSLWGDDKKIFSDKNYNLVCLNTILPDFSNQIHIEDETMVWFENALPKSNSKKIITFSYYPISKADNSSKFFESSLDYKLFSFVSKEEKERNEIPSLEGFYLNRKNDWGYLLINMKKDSLFIRKILGEEVKKKTKPEIVNSDFKSVTLLKSIIPVKLFSSVRVLWSVNFDKTIVASPVYRNDKIFAGFKNGTLICFTAPGTEKWRYDCHGKIRSSPIISEDLLIAATTDGDVLTINSNTGPPAQTIGIGESITGNAVADIGENTKAIFAATISGDVYCYNLETLELIWTNQISDNIISSTIVYSKNKIFFQDKEGTLYCLSADNGLLIWKLSAAQGGWKTQTVNSKTIFKTDIVVNNTNLYLIDAVGSLYCIDALLGTKNWNIKNIDSNGLIRSNKKSELVLPTTKNKILIVSPKLGKVTSEIELPIETKNTEITDLQAIGDNMLIGFSDGWVHRIKPKQKPEKIFRSGSVPIVSLTNVNGDCLVTDYDGNFTLLKISAGTK
jgi:outer membrane protein assembly factor BamB